MCPRDIPPALSCLRDMPQQLRLLIDATVDSGVRHLSFRSTLPMDEQAAALSRRAGVLLHKLRAPISNSFLREMRAALAHGEDAKAAPGTATLDVSLDETLEDQLDGAHLQDAAEIACHAEHVAFHALFCGANGEHVVQQPHPLRPEVHARCLAAALREPPVPRAVRNVWFTHLGEPLGMKLGVFYANLSRQLRTAGAREAQFLPPMVAGRRFERWAAPAR